MERAGIDIITDGEIRRESYSNRFATALEGIDTAKPGHVKARIGPADAGAARRRQDPAHAGRSRCATCSSCAPTPTGVAKITLPGPFTMSQQAKNEFYKDEEEMVMDYAVAVNAEARDLEKAGADVIQLDEPWLRNDPDAAKRIAVKAINRALRGPEGADHRAPVLRLRRRWCRARPSRSATRSCRSSPTASAEQISIEAAQPKLDLGVLKDLAPQEGHARACIDLNDPEGRDAADRSPSASAPA